MAEFVHVTAADAAPVDSAESGVMESKEHDAGDASEKDRYGYYNVDPSPNQPGVDKSQSAAAHTYDVGYKKWESLDLNRLNVAESVSAASAGAAVADTSKGAREGDAFAAALEREEAKKARKAEKAKKKEEKARRKAEKKRKKKLAKENSEQAQNNEEYVPPFSPITLENVGLLKVYDLRQLCDQKNLYDPDRDGYPPNFDMLLRIYVCYLKEQKDKADAELQRQRDETTLCGQMLQEKSDGSKETAAEMMARKKAERKAAAIERSRQRQAEATYFKAAKEANENAKLKEEKKKKLVMETGMLGVREGSSEVPVSEEKSLAELASEKAKGIRVGPSIF